MSVTVTNEVKKAEALASGLKKHLSEVKEIGITAEKISELEETCKILVQKDNESEALRRQVSEKSAENHRLLAELKNQMLDIRRAVKSRFLQPEWIKYGVQDKR